MVDSGGKRQVVVEGEGKWEEWIEGGDGGMVEAMLLGVAEARVKVWWVWMVGWVEVLGCVVTE